MNSHQIAELTTNAVEGFGERVRSRAQRSFDAVSRAYQPNANPAVPNSVSAMQDIPLIHIQESKTNH